jgi:hypothetical protein
MTKFRLIQSSTGEWTLPENINRAIATALVHGHRLHVHRFDALTGVVELVTSPGDDIVPNAETLEAMKAAETGDVVGPFKTVDDLLQDLNADD